jgi:hypothetical protein
MNSMQPNSTPGAAGHKPEMPPSDAQVLLTEIQLRQLAELRDMGMQLARDLVAQDDENGKQPSTIRTADAFARLSKAIRQIMALEQETIGLREKRVHQVRQSWMNSKRAAVRKSVDRSVAAAKPEMNRIGRERLLGDLFSDYDYDRSSVRDIVAGICKTLGVTADLSLWEEPEPADIALPEGYRWVIPANGDKPYTTVMNKAGFTVRLGFDSPHIERRGNDPPTRN